MIIIYSCIIVIFFPIFCYPDTSLLQSLEIKINGNINTVIKHQNSYKTPFDHPQYGYDLKSGANHRYDQSIRATGDIFIFKGELGKSEWFSGAYITLDANDPDTDSTESGEYNESVIELQNIILMYRPFVFKGGRPIGVTVGIQTVPSTINGYNTYLFNGDPDNDFAANFVSGLINVPAITLDCHFNENTGIGFTYAKGCSYISEAGAFLNKDSARTLALWSKIKLYNFHFSGAYQYVKGNRGATDTITTDSGNSYSEYDDHGFDHFISNITMAFSIPLHHFGEITPFIGYQLMKGDETPLPDYSDTNSSIHGFTYTAYGPRSIQGELRTIGLKMTSDVLLKKTSEICIELTQNNMEDMNGIDGLKKGAVDRYIQPAIDYFSPGQWSISSLSGKSSTINKFVDVDYVLNSEYCLSLNESIKIGLFYYRLKAKDDPTINNKAFIEHQIYERTKLKLINENGLSNEQADSISQAILRYLNEPQNMGDGIDLTPIQDILNDTLAAEWTNTESFGIFMKYSF